ncbi:hypothetical protein ACFFK0_01635 [Paenibacillus chartarius]|uniref:Uncharacterized protein n=1 Tax=Paenibacillus chartarius TaxID=747481 RepID=A0ABV6DEV0_9BACL
MWKNEKATTEQLHQATGVPIDTIEQFLKQERLRIRSFVNLTYRCERCGRGIREARICLHCAHEFKQAFQPEKRAEPAAAAGIGFRSRM